MSNDEGRNRCAQSFFKNNNDRIPYFNIRYSLFDIPYLSACGGFAFSGFLFAFERHFFWPMAGLNTDT
jgi:hypothetical protein